MQPAHQDGGIGMVELRELPGGQSGDDDDEHEQHDPRGDRAPGRGKDGTHVRNLHYLIEET